MVKNPLELKFIPELNLDHSITHLDYSNIITQHASRSKSSLGRLKIRHFGGQKTANEAIFTLLKDWPLVSDRDDNNIFFFFSKSNVLESFQDGDIHIENTNLVMENRKSVWIAKQKKKKKEVENIKGDGS
jgi:hypothetical protein